MMDVMSQSSVALLQMCTLSKEGVLQSNLAMHCLLKLLLMTVVLRKCLRPLQLDTMSIVCPPVKKDNLQLSKPSSNEHGVPSLPETTSDGRKVFFIKKAVYLLVV